MSVLSYSVLLQEHDFHISLVDCKALYLRCIHIPCDAMNFLDLP